MAPSRTALAHHCCGIQKAQVKEGMRACREAYDDPKAIHNCFRDTAAISKKATVACMSK